MSERTVQERVFDIVSNEYGVERGAVAMGTRLDEFGDSLDKVVFVIELEKAFSISIDDDDPGPFSTAGDAVRLVERLHTPLSPARGSHRRVSE